MPLVGSAMDVLASARFRGAVLLDEQSSTPGTPDSGQAMLYATAAGLVWKNSAGTERQLATTDRPVVSPAFSHTGDLAVGTGKFTYFNDTGRTLTITCVRASVTTAPTGSSILIDVNIGGTTIYTTQGNRPAIAISGTAVKSTNMNVTAWPDGEYLTVDIDQIGSTVKGANLTVQITAV